MREANSIISEVCQELKQIAKELTPSRIEGYCEKAEQYRHRFWERFGQAQTEDFDVDGFLQGFGYQNEDDFMVRFQERIENAKGAENVEDALEDLEEIGRTIREMDGNLTEEMGRHRVQHGQEATGSGYGQNSKGYGGSSSSGQPDFGGGQ